VGVSSGPDDRQRFEAVFGEVYEPLQRYVRRRIDPDDADDALSDALLAIWRRVHDIPSDAVLAWCYGVARACLANQRRGKDRRLKLVGRLAREREPSTPTDDPLLDALDCLPDADREVLRLWAWEQLPPREIAVVLDITPNAASIRLHRATQKLKAEVERRKDRSSPGHTREQQGKEAAP
jgi:RNA polymerase sigma-70 factor (ECF subfamily)